MGAKKVLLTVVLALGLATLGAGAGLREQRAGQAEAVGSVAWPDEEVVPAGQRKDDPKDAATPRGGVAREEKALQGVWRVESLRVAGEQAAEGEAPGFGVDPRLDEPGWYVLPMLLHNKSVRRELKFTATQITGVERAAAAIWKENGQAIRKALRESKGKVETYEAARKAIQARCLKAFGKELTATLKPEQVRRMVQIQRQRRDVRVFTDPEVEKALRLTAKQRDEVRSIVNDFLKDQAAEIGRISGPRFDPERLQAKRDLALARVVALLEDRQKKTWQTIIGQPFKVQPDPPPDGQRRSEP